MSQFKQYDQDYLSLVEHILQHEDVQKMATIIHHRYTNRLQHSISVSYTSYKIAKKLRLNYQAVARAALLHDFFLLDREGIAELQLGAHANIHPKLACINASRIIDLNNIERDIILKHMFLVSSCWFPRYLESFLVTFVDKYVAIKEVSTPLTLKTKHVIARLRPTSA